MNKNLLRSRFFQILTLTCVLMIILCIRLFVLAVAQQEKWSEVADYQSTKEISLPAPRGEIFDRNGKLLAGNRHVFTVEFNLSGLETEEINNSIYGLIGILEKNNEKYINNFPIIIDSDGGFYYSFDKEKANWLKENELPEDATAEDAFNKIRESKEIDPELDRFEAMKVLQESYKVYPPIRIRSMTFSFDADKKDFLDKYGLDQNLDATTAFAQLREKYSIDKELSDLEVRKLFAIRHEVKSLGYNKFRSSVVATDVSNMTVLQIEENNKSLPGVTIGNDTVRYYPYGTSFAHALGYMGSISDSQYEEYVVEKGYEPSDLIGKDGLEAYLEEYLRGKNGTQTILVDSLGNYVNTVSQEEPQKGCDVQLAVDIELQKVAEDTLKGVIEATQKGGKFESKYGNVVQGVSKNCGSGATVAIDVKTGQVLAMANYPSFDPNIFASGISSEDWASVQSTNPRDPLAPTPLYNSSTMLSVQPGSTFKPITSIAALECGLDPNRRIYDGGYIKIGGISFGCFSWNTARASHGYETLYQGIQNSCNYYFYCIATNTDWNGGANGPSLGYKEDISIEKIVGVAERLGLGEKTGVELYEATTPLPSAERKMDGMKYSLWNYLYFSCEDYWPKNIVSDEYLLRKELDIITGWIEENPSRDEIVSKIKNETKVLKGKEGELADLCKYSYFNLAKWQIGDVFNICIGQGDNAFTPLQMANYVATLGNGGMRNKVSLVKEVEGTEYEREEPVATNIKQEHLDDVIKGMSYVTTGVGPLAGYYRNFPWKVASKTGTAEREGNINPKDEVAFIKENLGRIAPSLTWEQVETEMKKLMKEEPEEYPTENDAVDMAVVIASDKKVSISKINSYKEPYESFAWNIALAPVDDPQIAIATVLVQGRYSYNVTPIPREIIGAYMEGKSKTQNQTTNTDKQQ